MKYLIVLLLFTGCITERKVEKYLNTHPLELEEMFYARVLPIEKTDTFTIVKDSLIVQSITDTLVQWMVDTKYITKDRIVKLLEPCKDSVKIIKVTTYDHNFEALYKAKKIDYEKQINKNNTLKTINRYLILGLILIIILILKFR